MYRRYSQSAEGTQSMTQVRRNRIRNLIILLLLLALVALLIISLPLLKNRNETRVLFIQRIQAEVDEAVRQTSSLSRNAGADSAAILARVRSCLYAVRSLCGVSASMGQGALLDDERLVTLQNTVDRYLSFLTTGMDTGEYQTGLQTALTELQTLAGELK